MDLHQQPFATRLSWLEELAVTHSANYIAETAQRNAYQLKHPTKIIALKCMDGRLHLPHATKTPLGIIQPYRNLGGIFDLGWPYLGDLLCEDIQQSLQAGQPVLVLVTYHYSAGDKWRGCAGFHCDKDAALAQALVIRDQLQQIFADAPQCFALVVGYETDSDALVLHGSTGRMLDLNQYTPAIAPQLPVLLQQLCPQLPNAMQQDLLPLLQGNLLHSAEQSNKRRQLDVEHREWMLCLGRGFDFLHVPNIALIIGPFSPDLSQPIKKAAAIIRSNIAKQRIADDGILLLASVPYYQQGADRKRAELKAAFFCQFAKAVISEEEPTLLPLLQSRSAVMYWPRRQLEWL